MSQFTYAHGTYDSEERAFRGFGRVDQVDTQYFTDRTRLLPAADTVADDLQQAPVQTRSWFHCGTLAPGPVSRPYQDEYYNADPFAPTLQSTLPAGRSVAVARESSRALAGRLVRREVWALGHRGEPDPDHPYTVSEWSFIVRQLQATADGKAIVHHAHEDQHVELRYELKAGDPQVTHDFTLSLDEYGHVTESAAVAYGRRSSEMPEQARTLAMYTTRAYGARTSEPAGFRHGVVTDEQTYELRELPVTKESPLTGVRLRQWIRSAPRVEFHLEPEPGRPQVRLVAHMRSSFWNDEGTRVLPAGEVGLLALPHNTYRKAMTRGLREKVYGARAVDALAGEGGYDVDSQGAWWVTDGDVRSGFVVFDPRRFYLPVQWNDELGRTFHVRYDANALMPIETTDPLQNRTKASIDYRTMLPSEVVDSNHNRTFYAFDALGRVTGTAVAGKADEKLGDSLAGFQGHTNGLHTWERHYTYSATSNRLVASGHPEQLQPYQHDENGNVASISPSSHIEWDHVDRLRVYREGEVRATYDYDGAGGRLRKTVERGPSIDVRMYFGEYERFERRHGVLQLVRHTTHVSIGQLRVSNVEVTTTADGRDVESPQPRIRFQIHDHLESVRLEVDEEGALISCEEFHPFGTSAYRAGRNEVEVGEKRFRYLGKEHDQESGLYYFGARYYAPWLGRWISCDPAGLADGPNVYAYVGNNPIRFIDRHGLSRAQAARFRKEHGMKGRDVQAGHTAAIRHTKESGISTEKHETAGMQQLHSREGRGLDVTVTDPKTGKETTRTRHTAQEGMINDSVDRARRGGADEGFIGPQKLTPEGQLDAAREVEWRTAGTGLDQREVEAKRASGLHDEQAAIEKMAAGKDSPVARYRDETAAQKGAAKTAAEGGGKAVKEAGEKAAEKVVKEGGGTVAKIVSGVGEVIAEKGGKLIPGVGAAVGAVETGKKLNEGDYAGAFVEAAGASDIPVVSQVADIGSILAEVAWVVKEVVDPERKAEQWCYENLAK